MKKTFVAISLLSTLAAQAQVSPTANHHSTVLTSSEGQDIWKTMRADFESGSECFNRAETWTYDVHKKYGYEAKKILIHYSFQYNQELSAKWGFHIAPMYNINGEDTVYDKGFQPWLHAPISPKMWEQKFLIAGTDKLVEKRIKLKEKMSKLEEDIYDLDKSSEFYYDSLKTKQDKLRELKAEMRAFKITDADLKEQKPKKIAQINNWIEYLTSEMKKLRSNSATYRSLKWQLDYQKKLLRKVKNDLNYAAHIECQKIDNIEELDYQKTGAWCFIQEVSQYYWGVPQLRLLNYGPGHGMNSLPQRGQLNSARREGAKYAHHNQFNMNDVWTARKQAFGPAYKKIWSKEYDLKEKSAEAVSKIDNIADDLSDESKDARNTKSKINKIVNKRNKKLQSYAERARALVEENMRNSLFGQNAMKEIYAVAQSVSMSDVETKANLYKIAHKKLSQSENNNEKLNNILDQVEAKLKSIIKKEKDDAKAEARRIKDEQRRQRERDREQRRRNRN